MGEVGKRFYKRGGVHSNEPSSSSTTPVGDEPPVGDVSQTTEEENDVEAKLDEKIDETEELEKKDDNEKEEITANDIKDEVGNENNINENSLNPNVDVTENENVEPSIVNDVLEEVPAPCEESLRNNNDESANRSANNEGDEILKEIDACEDQESPDDDTKRPTSFPKPVGKLGTEWAITFEQFLASMLMEPELVNYFEEAPDILPLMEAYRSKKALQRQLSESFSGST